MEEISKERDGPNHQVYHVHHDEIRRMPFIVYSLEFLIIDHTKILGKY